MLDFILVGRSPHGSAIRAALIAVLITTFWNLFLTRSWQLLVVSLVTALVVVIAAHRMSSRDDPWRSGKGDGFDG
ncbi:MAG: hypothetical protein ACTSSQ_03035 [Alphaproteobacteria bacterium]